MILTLALLKSMKPGEVFRVVTTKYQTLYQTGDLELTFVCKRGGGLDWAIYGGLPTWGLERIKTNGDKVTGEGLIKSLVPCDDEAFKLYRY